MARSSTSSSWSSSSSMTLPLLLIICQLQLLYAEVLDENEDLEQQCIQLQAERDAAEARARSQQYAFYTRQINEYAREERERGSRRVAEPVQAPTPDAEQIQAPPDTIRRVEEWRRETERHRQRGEAQRMDPVQPPEQDRPIVLEAQFSGNMKTMNKSTLVEIARALQVPNAAFMTLNVLRPHLNAHFDAHPELKRDPRFIGLFERTRKRKSAPM
ncbi:hypothetical protein FB446DRAFT_321564 [Lentinula raphanica]|nr:hypothetical protein FB446DRAFT_321564 [Lentinula raphanica]